LSDFGASSSLLCAFFDFASLFASLFALSLFGRFIAFLSVPCDCVSLSDFEPDTKYDMMLFSSSSCFAVFPAFRVLFCKELVAVIERTWNGCDCACAAQNMHTGRFCHDETRRRFRRSIERAYSKKRMYCVWHATARSLAPPQKMCRRLCQHNAGDRQSDVQRRDKHDTTFERRQDVGTNGQQRCESVRKMADAWFGKDCPDVCSAHLEMVIFDLRCGVAQQITGAYVTANSAARSSSTRGAAPEPPSAAGACARLSGLASSVAPHNFDLR
jgi:hypothetical protein